jgi:hypothetical protein
MPGGDTVLLVAMSTGSNHWHDEPLSTEYLLYWILLDASWVKRRSSRICSIVSLPPAQSKELIPRKAAIGNCYLSLDNT